MAAPQLNPTQVEQLLQTLAAQLRCDPNQLRQQLQSGNFGAVASSLNPNDAQQVQNLLKNPKQLQQGMNSAEMKELLRKLQGK